jgi:hypothetical protein
MDATKFVADAMKTRTLAKREVEAQPFRSVWNAYVDLLAMERYQDLTEEQRPAHLVFWYESEVQNGGHLQYFQNRGTAHLEETLDALGLLEATCQAQVLREAKEVLLGCKRQPIETVDEFVAAALEGEFSAFDSRFYACSPSLQKCLEVYLFRHPSAFVTII